MPKHQRDNRKSRRSTPYEEGEERDSNHGGSSKHHSKSNGGRSKSSSRSFSRSFSKSSSKSSSRSGFDSIHTPCATFDDMKLKPDLLKGVYAYGFEKPSAIQQRAIKPIVLGRDVIAQSQSGTGKTAVFSIAALQLLDSASREVQVLVLSPTRELAEQSQRVMQSLGDFMNVHCHACIGGKSLGNDLKELEKGGVQVVSGTPGRVFDLIKRNALQMSRLKAMILDEADEMLSRAASNDGASFDNYAGTAHVRAELFHHWPPGSGSDLVVTAEAPNKKHSTRNSTTRKQQ